MKFDSSKIVRPVGLNSQTKLIAIVDSNGVTARQLYVTFIDKCDSLLKTPMSLLFLVTICTACGDGLQMPDSYYSNNSEASGIATASANFESPYSVVETASTVGLAAASQPDLGAAQTAGSSSGINVEESVGSILPNEQTTTTDLPNEQTTTTDLPNEQTTTTDVPNEQTTTTEQGNVVEQYIPEVVENSSTSTDTGVSKPDIVVNVAIDSTSPDSNEGKLFSAIKNDGLANACYLDDDHYVAEYLYQNPDVCFWSVDSASKRVTPQDTPTPPADAVRLPAPSGGDDTAILQKVINANANGSVVGDGVYKIKNLSINVPIDIFNMSMIPASGARKIVVINSTDVRIFNSPIDGRNSKSATIGYDVSTGSHRFTLVDSGYSNVKHKNQESIAGVMIRGVNDFHIACNTFENLINDTSDSSKTARANSIWMNGRGKESTSGGLIVNNVAKNHQSNGSRKDAEFFTIQNYRKTDPINPVRIFANRTTNAGKRFTKHQSDNAIVLSNEHNWPVKQGPLGGRLLLSHVEIQFSDNVIARNNRVKIGAGSRFDYVFNTAVNYGVKVQNNIHYDCNDIEITDVLDPNSGNVPHIIAARMTTRPKGSRGYEATNSSANYNYIHGEGSVRYHYWFGEGYVDDGGKFETIGNVFEIPYLNAEYKNP